MSSIYYQLVYPNPHKKEKEPSGGYVEVHKTHTNHESGHNLKTAMFLAKRGFKVRLLPIDNTPGIKNPDAYLIDEQIIIEFKHNRTPTASAIENEVKDGKKQADHLLIHVLSDLTAELLIKGLRLHIHRARNVRQVWLIFEDELYVLSPEEIRSRGAELKIKKVEPAGGFNSVGVEDLSPTVTNIRQFE